MVGDDGQMVKREAAFLSSASIPPTAPSPISQQQALVTYDPVRQPQGAVQSEPPPRVSQHGSTTKANGRFGAHVQRKNNIRRETKSKGQLPPPKRTNISNQRPRVNKKKSIATRNSSVSTKQYNSKARPREIDENRRTSRHLDTKRRPISRASSSPGFTQNTQRFFSDDEDEEDDRPKKDKKTYNWDDSYSPSERYSRRPYPSSSSPRYGYDDSRDFEDDRGASLRTPRFTRSSYRDSSPRYRASDGRYVRSYSSSNVDRAKVDEGINTPGHSERSKLEDGDTGLPPLTRSSVRTRIHLSKPQEVDMSLTPPESSPNLVHQIVEQALVSLGQLPRDRPSSVPAETLERRIAELEWQLLDRSKETRRLEEDNTVLQNRLHKVEQEYSGLMAKANRVDDALSKLDAAVASRSKALVEESPIQSKTADDKPSKLLKKQLESTVLELSELKSQFEKLKENSEVVKGKRKTELEEVVQVEEKKSKKSKNHDKKKRVLQDDDSEDEIVRKVRERMKEKEMKEIERLKEKARKEKEKLKEKERKELERQKERDNKERLKKIEKRAKELEQMKLKERKESEKTREQEKGAGKVRKAKVSSLTVSSNLQEPAVWSVLEQAKQWLRENPKGSKKKKADSGLSEAEPELKKSKKSKVRKPSSDDSSIGSDESTELKSSSSRKSSRQRQKEALAFAAMENGTSAGVARPPPPSLVRCFPSDYRWLTEFKVGHKSFPWFGKPVLPRNYNIEPLDTGAYFMLLSADPKCKETSRALRHYLGWRHSLAPSDARSIANRTYRLANDGFVSISAHDSLEVKVVAMSEDGGCQKMHSFKVHFELVMKNPVDKTRKDNDLRGYFGYHTYRSKGDVKTSCIDLLFRLVYNRLELRAVFIRLQSLT